MMQPVVLTNVIMGILVCGILIWTKNSVIDQYELIIQKLEENTKAQSSIATSINEAITKALKSISYASTISEQEIKQEMHVAFMEVIAKVEMQNNTIHDMHKFMNVRYAIFLENDKKNKAKIAQLTNESKDIEASEIANRTYEDHIKTQRMALAIKSE